MAAKKTSKKNKKYTYAVGRRKSASARIRLFKGKAKNTINGMDIDKYFPGEVNKDAYTYPFRLLDVSDKYYITVRVVGSGKKSQLDAVVHGTAKALASLKEDYRLVLKKAGLLTRDARVRERRKPGTGGRARRQKQSPKR